MALHVEFFTAAKENQRRSKAEGRPVYDDIEMVRIRYPRDNKRVHVAPAHERAFVRGVGKVSYAERFPEHYEAFRRGQEFIGTGTPLKDAPFLTEARRMELQRSGVMTVDALAEMDATALRRLGMGYVQLGEQARKFLEAAHKTADETEKAELRAQIDELRAMMSEMQAKPRTLSDALVDHEEADAAPFEGMDDAALKAMIKDATGAAPRGNPSREALVRMAREAAG